MALGAELPAAGDDFLPAPDVIVQATSGEASGQSIGSTMQADEPSSGRPARPADPPEEDDTAAHFAREAAAWLRLDLNEEQLAQATAAIAAGADALEAVHQAHEEGPAA